MMVTVEQLMERRLTRKTEVLGENLPQRHYVHHKFHMNRAGSNPGHRGGEPVTNHLSYGSAFNEVLNQHVILTNVRFQILTAVTLKIAVFWGVTSALKNVLP
jgi:hypothetical protein